MARGKANAPAPKAAAVIFTTPSPLIGPDPNKASVRRSHTFNGTGIDEKQNDEVLVIDINFASLCAFKAGRGMSERSRSQLHMVFK